MAELPDGDRFVFDIHRATVVAGGCLNARLRALGVPPDVAKRETDLFRHAIMEHAVRVVEFAAGAAVTKKGG